MEVVKSKKDVSIRLSQERWLHITESHTEMAGHYYEVLETVADPEEIHEGKEGAQIAVKGIGDNKYIVVVYKELDQADGFIITAYKTGRKNQFERRKTIWKRPPE